MSVFRENINKMNQQEREESWLHGDERSKLREGDLRAGAVHCHD